jgi:alpha-1,3-mannosyltransferase
VLWGYQFITTNPYSYFTNAFQFNRQFLYKWTVNWRFIDENTFLSPGFSYFLLGSHALVLGIFITTRWIKPTGRDLINFLKDSITKPAGPFDQDAISWRMSPEFIMTTMLTANAIGMLYARSLHYQFYAWTAWATPFLLSRSAKLPPPPVWALWMAQEWAWNVYPSTKNSSLAVVLVLAVTVRSVWSGTREDFKDVAAQDGIVIEDRTGNAHPHQE